MKLAKIIIKEFRIIKIYQMIMIMNDRDLMIGYFNIIFNFFKNIRV